MVVEIKKTKEELIEEIKNIAEKEICDLFKNDENKYLFNLNLDDLKNQFQGDYFLVVYQDGRSYFTTSMSRMMYLKQQENKEIKALFMIHFTEFFGFSFSKF